MADTIVVFIAIVGGFFAIDWLIATRIGAFYTDFDYHYKLTATGLIAATFTCGYLMYFYINNDVDHPSVTRILIGGMIFAIYAAIIVRDVRLQRTRD